MTAEARTTVKLALDQLVRDREGPYVRGGGWTKHDRSLDSVVWMPRARWPEPSIFAALAIENGAPV